MITEEEYQDLLSLPPEDRCNKSGNLIDDKISGILIAYSKLYDLRDGWIDFITISDAEKEIKKLIIDCGGTLTKH